MPLFVISVETLATLGLILVTFFYRRPQSTIFPSKKRKIGLTYHQLLSEIKDILNPTDLNIEGQLTERASANQRLVRALHLSNTFVSQDSAVHRAFVTHAQHLLKGAQRRGWRHFHDIAIEVVQWQLSSLHQCHSQSHPSEPSKKAQEVSFKFDSFVQNITLVVILVGLLRVDKLIQSFSHHDVALVAERITTLWALSKKPKPIPPDLLEDLTTHLCRLVPLNGSEDGAHLLKPLDFVIPAWETLWRVVATTVAYACGAEDMKNAFADFNACPSDESFQQVHADKALSVKSIVSEAMRLHPPSKHIGRLRRKWRWWPSFLAHFGPGMSVTRRQADIEGLLRCEIWGPDPDDFRPSRHYPSGNIARQVQAMTFVFGYGPLHCIASSWAPMAAGVIAGAILDQLEINGLMVYPGPLIGGREGWNDWTVKVSV